MKCSKCEWPTPASRRDLFSGKCDVCQKPAPKFAGQTPEQAKTTRQLRRAANELVRNVPPAEVVRQLVELGHPSERAERMVAGLLAERESKTQQLREQHGLAEGTSAAEVQAHHKKKESRRVRLFGLLTLLIGLVLLGVGGLFLYLAFSANNTADIRGYGNGIAVLAFVLGGIATFVSLLQVVFGRAEFARYVFRLFGMRWD